MRRFGIIGKPLGHSYSERYFTEKFAREHIDATYHAFAIDQIKDVLPLLEELEGFNVTFPYKEAILPYLKGIDPIAEKIGAVNVVYQGIGYNTDWLGFKDSLHSMVGIMPQRALLLGTGGVSKAIQYALDDMCIGYTLVSRQRKASGKMQEVIRYDEVDEKVLQVHTMVVNCTPLGMHPYENEFPAIPYQHIGNKHLLYDCIYNPSKTLFLREGKIRGCCIKNGLEMLHRQADEAWQIWNKI